MIYCSEACLAKDSNHINYHKNISKYFKQDFSLEELMKTNLNDILDSSFYCGRVGMRNLGNTCFMSSALQCLSHCPDLTKYFLLDKHQNEINLTNKLGSGGQVVRAYASLIDQLWTGSHQSISPWEFRKIFIRYSTQVSPIT